MIGIVTTFSMTQARRLLVIVGASLQQRAGTRAESQRQGGQKDLTQLTDELLAPDVMAVSGMD